MTLLLSTSFTGYWRQQARKVHDTVNINLGRLVGGNVEDPDMSGRGSFGVFGWSAFICAAMATTSEKEYERLATREFEGHVRGLRRENPFLQAERLRIPSWPEK